MFEARYTLRDGASGREGSLRLAGGIWIGDACGFEFTDTVFGLSGAAACDWREPRSRLWVDEGATASAGAQALLDRITTLLSPFHRATFRHTSQAGLSLAHASDSHLAGSAARLPHVVEQLLRLCAPGRVVDAGCAAGGVVRELRRRGVEAFGFDVSADALRAADADVAPLLRSGNVDAIPFGPDDGIDTLLALDVFEHVPEHRVRPMVAEFARLGVRRVVAHMALCEFHHPGHVTLRPLSWWDRQMSPWFHRVVPAAQPNVAAAFDGDPARYLRVWELAEVPARV